MPKQRLDTLLVDLGHCDSRQQAQRLIRAGEVMVNQQVFDKPGMDVDVAAQIQVKQRSPYVSRGGEKLAKAIAEFEIAVAGRVCLDGGISTGGFTDCLLQAGAQQVYGVDVGYGQVAWSLRQDGRVTLLERTNLRNLKVEDLYGTTEPLADLGVVDVSFISLTKVLAALWSLLRSPREVVLLVKPQFEVGRDRIGKNGVVRDAKDQAMAIGQVLQAAQALGWCDRGLTWSPLLGPAGNIEYLLWMVEGAVSPEEIAPEEIAPEEIAPEEIALEASGQEAISPAAIVVDATPGLAPGPDAKRLLLLTQAAQKALLQKGGDGPPA